jgi:hypothetical protein
MGKFVWCPPPAAADVALEELRKALIKRRDATHVFLCPRLLTPQWRRQLNKPHDLVVFMNAGSEILPTNVYEPLTIGFVFPFLNVRPWQIRGTPKMLNLGRTMPKCYKTRTWLQGIFCANYASRCGIYTPCQKMWCGECYTSHPTILFHVRQKGSFEGHQSSEQDQERVTKAWGRKHRAPDEYLVGRDGDHLLIPFECDLCIFRKLRHHDPLITSEQDKLLLACIRRISLDAFWSRASSTVLAN